MQTPSSKRVSDGVMWDPITMSGWKFGSYIKPAVRPFKPNSPALNTTQLDAPSYRWNAGTWKEGLTGPVEKEWDKDRSVSLPLLWLTLLCGSFSLVASRRVLCYR